MITTINLKKRKPIVSLLVTIAFALSLTFFSCEAIIECIINIHPSLPLQQLMIGYFNEVYYDEIKASMINEPYNDDYDYNFIIEGRLPVGIWTWGNGRTLIIEGQPIETGIFPIKVVVSAVPHDPEAFICNDEASQEYTLMIEE